MLARKKKTKNENDIFKNIPTVMDEILPDAIREYKDYLYLGFNKYKEFSRTSFMGRIIYNHSTVVFYVYI